MRFLSAAFTWLHEWNTSQGCLEESREQYPYTMTQIGECVTNDLSDQYYTFYYLRKQSFPYNARLLATYSDLPLACDSLDPSVLSRAVWLRMLPSKVSVFTTSRKQQKKTSSRCEAGVRE